ncbi:MAG: beta keto-acyl synthase, partial [Myxococcota bacterium]|nr:beta keto-acyl synthase [Myxococcota bacterium]
MLAPESDVLEALADEPHVQLTILNAPGDVVLGGEAEATERVVGKIGRHRCQRLGYDVSLHCPEILGYRDEWYALHHRETTAVPGVRFYSGATGESYEASAERAAEAIVGMAVARFDFPALIEKAWNDGVRVFIEHGPRDGCAKWISRILGDRDHVAVALDRGGRSAMSQLVATVNTLREAGVAMDVEQLEAALRTASTPPRDEGPTRRYPVHLAPPKLPAFPKAKGDLVEHMAPAPWLPPVLGDPSSPSTAPVQAELPLPAPTAPRQPGSPVRRATESAPVGGPLDHASAMLAAHHARLSATHARYLQSRESTHQRFVAQREQARQALLGALEGGQGITPVTASPIEPAAARPALPTPTPPVASSPTAPAPAHSTAAKPPPPAPRPPPSEPRLPRAGRGGGGGGGW